MERPLRSWKARPARKTRMWRGDIEGSFLRGGVSGGFGNGREMREEERGWTYGGRGRGGRGRCSL